LLGGFGKFFVAKQTNHEQSREEISKKARARKNILLSFQQKIEIKKYLWCELMKQKKKNVFSNKSLITVLCSIVVIVFLIIAIVSGKVGEWTGNKKISDQPEVNFDLLKERTKLKDYCVFNLCQETARGSYILKTNAFLKEMNNELVDYLEWVVVHHNRSDNETLYKRGYKYIGFVGKFNVKNFPDRDTEADKINEWIKKNSDTWIVISKRHYSEQFEWQREEFLLKKDEPDYHEFGSKKEAIDWLRENDSYFRS